MENSECIEGYSVVELKKYLKKKGITVTNNSTRKDLLILCQAAKSLDSDPNHEDCDSLKIIEKKLLKIGVTTDPTTFPYTPNFQLADIPPFGLIDIFNYLIYSRSDYDHRKLKAFKSFDDYKLFEDGHVRKLEMYKNKDFCFFRSAVLPTCRKTTFLHKPTYICWFVLNSEGEVYVAYCECMGGADGGCRHIAASLYELNKYVSTVSSVTDGPCTWSNKSRPTDEPMLAKELFLQYRASSTSEEKSSLDFRQVCCSIQKPSADAINQFLDDLSKVDDTSTRLELHTITKNTETTKILEVDCSHLAPLQRIIKFYDENPKEYLDPYCLNNYRLYQSFELTLIEKLTKGQAENQNWFEMRRGMMTASNFHRIRSRSRSLQADRSLCAGALLRQLCRGQTAYATMPASLLWGRKCEKKALKLYKKLLPKLHLRPQVTTTGFCISDANYLIGGSPDGICSCKCRKTSNCPRRWLVEVKCPYTTKYRPAKVAAGKNGCIYDRIQRKWVLSKTHKHYAQVQGLMGILQYDHLDFVVYTTKGLVIIPVEFDKNFFDKMIFDLMYFQENYLFPYIVKMYLCRNVKITC